MRKNLWLEFAFEVAAGAYVVAVVLLGWRHPVRTSLLLAAGLGANMWFWRGKADAAAMIGAALLGTPAEILCVKLGIWTYDAPGVVFGIPVWIPLVWAYLLSYFRRVAFSLHSFMEIIWPTEGLIGRRVFFGALGGIIVLYYLVTVAVIRRIIALSYTALMIPAVIFWRGERDILVFLFGAVCGTFGEYLCMRFGFWNYHYPVFKSVGLPISLPLAWGLSSVVVGRIAGVWEKKEAHQLKGENNEH